MTRTLFLIALSALLTGCTANPGGDTPPSSPTDPPPPADGPLLRCTTAAFESDVFAPHQALRLQSNIDGDDSSVVELSLGAAHPDSEGVVAEPDASWQEQASLTWSEQGFDLSGADLTVSTWEWEGMYLGTVDHAEQGSHEVTCWFDDFEATYRYDGDSGRCLDAAGEEGINTYPVAYLRDTFDGNCGMWWALSLNEGFLGYPTWIGMDLRGARLGGASLHFANFLDASLEGTKFDGFEFGYAQVTGTIDEHTERLDENCTVDGNDMHCRR